jgi:hypothetical protein
MNDKMVWLLILGFVPFDWHFDYIPGGWQMTLRALFWNLQVKRQFNRQRGRQPWRKRTEWHLRIPLIEKLREAIWAAVLRLRDEEDK